MSSTILVFYLPSYFIILSSLLCVGLCLIFSVIFHDLIYLFFSMEMFCQRIWNLLVHDLKMVFDKDDCIWNLLNLRFGNLNLWWLLLILFIKVKLYEMCRFQSKRKECQHLRLHFTDTTECLLNDCGFIHPQTIFGIKSDGYNCFFFLSITSKEIKICKQILPKSSPSIHICLLLFNSSLISCPCVIHLLI